MRVIINASASPRSPKLGVLMTCEDFPCCGHTDGLGCDWVSPSEVVPCEICIEARASYPYHNGFTPCPTERARAMAAVPANTPCQFFGEDNDCDGEQANLTTDEGYFCFSCYHEFQSAMRDQQEQYDSSY